MSKIKALQVRFNFLLLLSFSRCLQLIIQERKFLEKVARFLLKLLKFSHKVLLFFCLILCSSIS